MDYSKDMQQITAAYNLQPHEIIFCFAVAAGANLGDTYKITFNKNKISTDLANDSAEKYINSTPATKILINRIKNKKVGKRLNDDENKSINESGNNIKELSEEEKNEFKTRSGLIEKIIDNVSVVSGKDAISGLQTLAKLQGYDKPDEDETKENRVYYLPYISDCKHCQLMKIYRDLTKNENEI